MVELPYPPDWKQRPEYLRDRIRRSYRALWFCKGRARDLKPLVEREIVELEALLAALESRQAGCGTPPEPTDQK